MLRGFDTTSRGVCLPCSITYDHTKVHCFGHHRQSKRCVRDHKLGTLFGPADPTACELRDPLANRPEENNTLSGIDVESKGTKGVQNVGEVSESTLAVCHAVQCSAKVDIVCVPNQVVVQPCMGIPLEEFLHYETHT